MLSRHEPWREAAAHASRTSCRRAVTASRAPSSPPISASGFSTAVADVASVAGYASMSVEGIIATAGVSRRTFYDHFSDKQEAFLAAYDAIVAPCSWTGCRSAVRFPTRRLLRAGCATVLAAFLTGFCAS